MQGPSIRSRAAPGATMKTCYGRRKFYIAFVEAHRYADLIFLMLEILLIPAAHMSCTLALRAGCAHRDQQEDAELHCSSSQMSSSRPALFLGAYDQTVVRDFPCRANVFGRAQYTLLRLYPLCFGSIWPLEAAEPLFMISLLVCLLANYLSTAAFIAGSSLTQRPTSDPDGDSHAQRCAALRHCFVAAVRLSFHGGCLLTVLQLWWRYGKQTGAMLLSLGSGRYYLINKRFQIIPFCLVQDVGALKMPLQLHVPLALFQAALAFATAVTCDLMTLGLVQQPLQTLAVMFCGMVVVPTAMLCIIERPQRQTYGENCRPPTSLRVKFIIDGQAGYRVPEPARVAAAAPWFPSRLLRPEEPVNEKALTLFRIQQSGAGDGNVGETSAAVECSDGGDGVAGVALKSRHDDLAEVAGCGAGIRGGLDDAITGGGSTCSTSSEATASLGNSGTSGGYDTTVWADSPLPVLYGQSESATHVSPSYHDVGSNFVGSSTHCHGSGDEPKLWMCGAEIMEPHAGEETHPSLCTDSQVSGLMPCDGPCRLQVKAAETPVHVTTAASSAAHNLPGGNRDRSPTSTFRQSGAVLCNQPLQLPKRPRRPVLDLRLLNPAHVPAGCVDLHGASTKHGGADCGSGAPAGCGGPQLADQEGRGAAFTAVVAGSAVSSACGSNLLYTSRLSSCVVSVKVDSHHFAGGEGFPQAAVALSGAASEAVRAYNAAALSAALRSNAAVGGGGVQPGSYGRKLIRKLGSGAVVRGCLHLIHVVRFPRSFDPRAPSRRLQLPLLPHDLEDGDAESPCFEAVASNIISTAEDAYTPVDAGNTHLSAQSQRRVLDPAVAFRESGPGAFPLPGVAAVGGPSASRVPSREAGGPSSGLCGSGEGCEVGTRGLYGSWRVSDGGSSSHDEAGHWSPFVSGERYVGSADSAASDGGDLDPWDQTFAAGGASNGGVRLIHIEIAAAPELSSPIDTASMTQLRGVGGGVAVSGGQLGDYAAESKRPVSPSGERRWSGVRDAHSGPLDGTAGGVVGSMVGGGLAWQPLHNFISVVDPMSGGSGISGVSGSADGFTVFSRPALRSDGSITQQQTAGNGLASFADKASESLAADRYSRKPLEEGVEMSTGAGVRGQEMYAMEQREDAPGGEDADDVKGGTHAPCSGVTAAAASGSGFNLHMELLRAYEQAAIAVSMTAAARGIGILVTHRTKSLGGGGGLLVDEIGGAVRSPRGSDHQQPLYAWDLLDSCNGIGGGEELLPCYLDAVAVTLSEPDSGGARPKVRVVLSPEAVAAIAELQPPAAQEMVTDVRSKVSELRVRVVVARAVGGGEASSSAVLDEPRVPLQPLQPLPQVDQQMAEQQQQQRRQQQVEGGHAHGFTWPAACLEVKMPAGLLLVEAVGGAMAVFIHLLAPREAPSDGSGQMADDKSHRMVGSDVSEKLETEPPTPGSVLPTQWLLQRSQSNTVSRRGGALGAGACPGMSTRVRLLRGCHNRVLAVLPLLLVADHAVAEELGMAYDEHATAIFFDSGATEEELQPHLPYSGSRLMAYRDHLYDLVTDIAELLTPPFPSPPAPTLAEAGVAAPDSEVLADLALTEATTTGEQILSYMCCRGMWASARMVVGMLRTCWGVEVGGAEALWTVGPSAPTFFSGPSIPHEAQGTAVDLPVCPGTASNEQLTRCMPTQGAVAGLSAIGESSWPPDRALIRAGGNGNVCEVPGARSSGKGASRGQAGMDGGDGHSDTANGGGPQCAFPVPRVIAQIICALKFAAVAGPYCYVVLQSSPQALRPLAMWAAPFIAVSVSIAMAMISPAFPSVPWSAALGLLLDGLLLGLVVMTCEALSVLPAQGQPMLRSTNSDVNDLGPSPSSSGLAMVMAMVMQVLMEPAALLELHPQVIAVLMAVRALAYVSVSVHWLGRPWTSAVTQWAAAVLGNLLVVHWLRRSYHLSGPADSGGRWQRRMSGLPRALRRRLNHMAPR